MSWLKEVIGTEKAIIAMCHMPAMPGEATIPATMPDRINGAIMVDPNSSAQPLDISSLQDNSTTNKNDAPQSDKSRSGSRRKTS